MKKTHSSPSVSRIVEEFERRLEQSTRSSPSKKSPSTIPSPQKSPRAKDKEQSN
ncbi:hypothetical protein MCO_01564, partial [Bartonella sp. DB5-6]